MAVDEDTRRHWNSERLIIDRLVDAVEAGNTDAKQALGQRLLDGIDDDNWNAGKFIEAGPFLPLTCLDLGLIRFGGHLPKGGYDVPNAQTQHDPAAPAAVL